MVRDHFADRGLGVLLGDRTFGSQDGLDYVEFQYLQPRPLEERGVDWLDDASFDYKVGGHGTYWEVCPWILATGTLSESTSDDTYGEREFHGKGGDGVYSTPQFDAWAGHYSWACNIFGNKCYYGIGFRVLASDKFLKRINVHPTKSTKVEWVHESRGVIITHVVVTINKSLQEGYMETLTGNVNKKAFKNLI